MPYWLQRLLTRPRALFRAYSKLGWAAALRLVRIRLHRIADEGVHSGERVREDAIVAGERRRRITIERRPDRIGQGGDADPLGVKHAVAIGEMMHLGSVEQRIDGKPPLVPRGRKWPAIGTDRERLDGGGPGRLRDRGAWRQVEWSLAPAAG